MEAITIPGLARLASVEPAESKWDLRKRTRSTGVCDNCSRRSATGWF